MRAQLLPLTLLCLLLSACGSGEPEPPAGVGSIAEIGSDGRWTAINYWAIWCYPCRTEIPEFNDFAADNSERVAVYAVNFDELRGEALLDQAAELGINFTLLEEDPAAALGYARPTVLPTTIILDPSGKLVARLIGPQTEASLEAEIE
jgi:thiol-disulfide isomerase/thioredoxin